MIVCPFSAPSAEKQKGSHTEAYEAGHNTSAPVGVMIVEQISSPPVPPTSIRVSIDWAAHVGLRCAMRQVLREDLSCTRFWDFLWKLEANLKGRANVAGVPPVWRPLLRLAVALVRSSRGLSRPVGNVKLMLIDRRGIFRPRDGEVSWR